MARAEVKVTLKDVPEVKALIERLTERAEAAEAAIERARSLLRDWEQSHDWSDGHCHKGYRIPNHDDCDSDCLHCASGAVLAALNETEASDGTR